MKKTHLITCALTAAILSTSCLGSYSAFNSLRAWNSQISNNKFVNNLLFWAMWIVPVYEIFILGDTVIFNVVEFWSGTNPIAMQEGQVETQTIVKNGNTYQMTATKNKMFINVIAGKDKGQSVTLLYNPEEKTWYAKKDGKTIKLSSLKDGSYVVYLPKGQEVYMSPSTTREEGTAILNTRTLNYLGKTNTIVAMAQ